MPGVKSWIIAFLTAATLVLGAFPSASAAELWWSICYVEEGHGTTAYGASWNYPTYTEAIEAACRACRQRVQGKEFSLGTLKCLRERVAADKNSCFLIQKVRAGYYSGNQPVYFTKFLMTLGFSSRVEAEEFARKDSRSITDLGPRQIELLKCAGVK